MGSVLASLQPASVWSIFEEIAGVPRPSTKERKIREWVKGWARAAGIPFKEDEAGNLLLMKDAAPGCGRFPVLVLQAHMDMVCQSAPGREFDFEKEPIRVKIEGKTVMADGTTLGADNGIGMAYALALLAEQDMAHGPLEVLLTANEETGFGGALGLKEGFFTGRYLLNLDSESQGEITIGSAGGGNTEYSLPANLVPVNTPGNNGFKGIRLSVEGLLSGHSGVQIHLPRLNAIKLVIEGLAQVAGSDGAHGRSDVHAVRDRGGVHPLLVHSFEGGSARNAIPAQASCVFLVPGERWGDAMKRLERWKTRVEGEWIEREPKMAIEVSPAGSRPGELSACSEAESGAILALLDEVPHGPIAFSDELPGLVQTSNNLAVVRSGSGSVNAACLSRSFSDDELGELRERLRGIGLKHGARVDQDAPYPGWSEDPSSPFLSLVRSRYGSIVTGEVRLSAVHAGLECGLFTKANPGIQIASVGPNIGDAHSPGEWVSIESVGTLWRVLRGIVEGMGTLEG